MHVHLLFFSGLAEVKIQEKKKPFRVLGGGLLWKLGREQERWGTAEMTWGDERGICPHTQRGFSVNASENSFPSLSRRGEGRGSTCCVCGVAQGPIWKENSPGEKALSPQAGEENSKKDAAWQSSGIAFASEESFIKKLVGKKMQ